MLITINDDYRIASDPYNFIVEQKKVGKAGASAGVERWEPVSYHADLDQAVKSLLTHQIRITDATGVEQVILAIQDAKRAITAALLERKRMKIEQLSLFGEETTTWQDSDMAGA